MSLLEANRPEVSVLHSGPAEYDSPEECCVGQPTRVSRSKPVQIYAIARKPVPQANRKISYQRMSRTMQYTRLNPAHSEIRLVTVLPGVDGSQIQCTIENMSLMRPPKYTALSYCWGDPNKTLDILVNDQPFPATTNLHAALSRLRDTKYTTLWIDAICINQEDVVERSQQLFLMGSIYRKATTTVAWLGDLAHCPANTIVKDSMFTASANASDASTATTLLRIRDIINNPYWRRVWIIQELALSQDIILAWSETLLEFSQFESSLKNLSEGYITDTLNHLGYQHVQDILQFRSDSINERPLSFLEALARSHMSLATDIRDKTFALLNMTYNGNTYIPIPNYSQNASDLCLEITKVALKATKSLDILVLLANPERESAPSWFPDWLSLDETGGNLRHKVSYALRKMSWPTQLH